MKKIAVVSSSRAEYGLLSPIIECLRSYEDNELRVELIVTGTHLDEKFGMTINEIISAGVRIDHEVPVLLDSSSSIGISETQAKTLREFTILFDQQHYNAVILLGDRYEMLSVAIAAGNTGTPVFHISGGDTTEGAIDEWVRHSITKISYLHFVTNDVSRKRVIQLGEEPSRVFNFGSTSIDNILKVADMSKQDALASVGLSDCDYALCTYHPATMGDYSVEYQIGELIKAIESFPDIEFIITKSNADMGGEKINELLDEADAKHKNVHVFSSLGVKRYLSLMKYSLFVLGNSSSGIVEAPAFHVPTVNIGDRQRGRLQSESIINCDTPSAAIVNAIERAMSSEHKNICEKIVSPYGDGNAAEKIAQLSVETVLKGNIDQRKKFYDL